MSATDAVGARQRLLADWWAHARNDSAGNVMIALRRRDVRDLNALGRQMMDAAGLLGAERVTYRGREFAVGDRIVCRRNDDLIGVRNGTRGTVADIDTADGRVTVATDDGHRIRLAPYYLERGLLQHAYALTGHSAQGATVDRAFVLAGEGDLREWGYVAASRARLRTAIYSVTEAAFAKALERSGQHGTAIGSGRPAAR